MSLAVGSPNAGAWETDDETTPPTFSMLRGPVMETRASGRGSRVSSRGSRHSRRSVTPPPRISSPPPMPGSDKTDKSDRVPRDMATDEKISILDPRRFTPTLHASLVGEILSLKRDQEEKRRVIEGLESQLSSTRDEQDGVHTTLQSTAKENRSLKRQLALLEGGTSSALAELARERDEAVEMAAESKRRLDVAQKKVKAQEDSASNAVGLWTSDKNDWEEERRRADRKIHILETRLKAVLEELAVYEEELSSREPAAEDNDADDRGSDAGSIRSVSMSISHRFSLAQKPSGLNLADELDFDNESEYGGTETGGRDSVMSSYMHMRTDSRASARTLKFHRRHTSGDSLIRPGSVTRGRFQLLQKEGMRGSNGIIREADEHQPRTTTTYVDTGVQFSPPPSPVLSPTKLALAGFELKGVPAMAAKWEKATFHDEISTEANSRRKRISIAKPISIQPAPLVPKLMVSAGAQTVDMPLSPPRTPRSPVEEEQGIVPEEKKVPEMVTCGTQTEASASPASPEFGLARIPSITIHPPATRPSAFKKARLPQQQKDAGCQVCLPPPRAPMVSASVQTEEIRTDQRLEKLPAHLHPSAIKSRPTSIVTAPAPEVQFTPVPGNIPARNPNRLKSQSSIISARGGGFNTDLRNVSDPSVAREAATRITDIFSAFHDISSGDEMDDFDEGHSDSEFGTALSAPRCAVKSPEPTGCSPTTPSTPDAVATTPQRKFDSKNGPASPLGNTNIYNAYKLSGNQGVAMPDRNSSMKSTGLRPSAMSSKTNMRKSTLIQNGIHMHQQEDDPPFPIPARASSRVQTNYSAGLSSASPPRSNEPHRRGTRTTMYRASSIRKSRSGRAGVAAAHKKRGSRSPSPLNTPPPLAFRNNNKNNNLAAATSNNNNTWPRQHRSQNSATTATTETPTTTGGFQSSNNNNSGGSQTTASGVVDAIAQTMVGEWMFKYVRRRKSFGLVGGGGDVGRGDDSSNDRHKRWVWLAPYERAILWSSKQPSSGTALLGGKSGRKLIIQSVLDVKDDNPPPKGHPALFNRSILILTPQRALKFTATTADRHYLWLTALSFLAHSQQDVPDIPTTLPLPPQHRQQVPEDLFEPLPPPQQQRQKRIRDSIRLAKSQNSIVNTLQQPSASTNLSAQSPRDARTVSPMPSIVAPAVAYRPESADSNAAEPPMISRFGRAASPQHQYSHNNHHQQQQLLHQQQLQQLQYPPPPQSFHGRKRSNTGGALRIPPPLSFRGFTSNTTTTAHTNLPSPPSTTTYHHHQQQDSQTTILSDFHFGGSAPHTSALEPTWSEVDRDGNEDSRASTMRSSSNNNMFEAIGTMRMEAFISPLASFSRYNDEPEPQPQVRKRTKEARRRKSRSRSRSRDGGGGVRRGGAGGWRDEYLSTYAAAGAAGGGGQSRGRRESGRRESGAGRRDSRYGVYGGSSRGDGYRTAGEEEGRRGRNPFEGF